MNLFVDANIYLDFYHFSNDDLDELKKLVDLVNKDEISLILTSQVIDEVRRNRDNKVVDAYKKFHESKISFNLPQICKGYSEYPKIMKALGSLQSLKTDLDNQLIADINKRTLKADKIINLLFKGANIIDSSKYVEKAKTRFDLGNPPGKNKSYGDAVTWTTLLSELEDKEDIFFISDDIDYKSPLDESLFNSFLLDEWKKNKNSDLFFYIKLSDFFNEHHKDIQLKVEEEKNELILKLSTSPNYSYTHAIIRRLSKYVSFTDEQIRNLTKTAIENSQVENILNDDDLKDFYEKLLENKEGVVEPELFKKIKEKFGEAEAETPESCDFCRGGNVEFGEVCPSCKNVSNFP